MVSMVISTATIALNSMSRRLSATLSSFHSGFGASHFSKVPLSRSVWPRV
jgi:hypothetical protein